MSRAKAEVLVGAVAYHPRIVTIWETFLEHFERHRVPTDYLLYSNYERLVAAALAGDVDVGWNTNTAFVALEQKLGREARILGMRDVDAEFATVIVTPRGASFADARELAGRRLALGSRDSGHAAILPLHYLGEQGLDAAAECDLVRFDTDLGKHGDTGDSELRVVRAVAEGRADAGALGETTLAAFRADHLPAVAELEVAWRSPTYYHCNFTALPSLEDSVVVRWQAALLAMSYDDPQMRQAMTLEGVKRWLPGDHSGYDDLAAAMRDASSPA
ncbi:MAG TPA: PhnD/SsuA/transferrin family substrate-binding protein [Solirubrobacteraceae bacterium]|jgi:ABC-type phosphate/phosphonate transport system substrate-binding protein|nr:PhnD/SsuA/transferrin family substrate-binding protein [Solirubrobacteraceae bacterium]